MLRGGWKMEEGSGVGRTGTDSTSNDSDRGASPASGSIIVDGCFDSWDDVVGVEIGVVGTAGDLEQFGP